MEYYYYCIRCDKIVAQPNRAAQKTQCPKCGQIITFINREAIDNKSISAYSAYSKMMLAGLKNLYDGHYAKAIESFKEAIRIEPGHPEDWYNLGFAYSQLGLYEEAIVIYKEAIRLKQDYALAYSNLGSAYNQLDLYDEAIEVCKQAIRLKPDFIEAYYNLASSYAWIGRCEEAIETCKNLIHIHPNFAEAHLLLANIYLSQGDIDSALRECEILKKLNIALANQLLNAIHTLTAHKEFDKEKPEGRTSQGHWFNRRQTKGSAEI